MNPFQTHRRVVYEYFVNVLLLVDEYGITHVILLTEIQQPGQNEAIVRRVVQIVEYYLAKRCSGLILARNVMIS